MSLRQEDYIGKKYGKLTIQNIRMDYVGVKKISKHNVADCICGCGNNTVVILSHLKSGHNKSCGCLRKGRVINDFSILTPDSCYWAGFIFGDGSINRKSKRLAVGLSIVDIEHLKKLSYFICGENRVKTYNNNKCNGKTYQSCHFSIANTNLANNLKTFGIVPNKTYESSLILPKKYQTDFIRGYFDADGCFTTNKREIYLYHRICWASYLKENLEIIAKYLPTTYKIYKTIRKTGQNKNSHIYTLESSHKSTIIDTINLLLPKHKCGVFLERKWDKIYDSIDAIKAHSKTHKDYIGDTFGSLTILDTYIKNHMALAQCKCVCGKDISVRLHDLKCDKTKSCGCLSNYYRKQTMKNKLKNR